MAPPITTASHTAPRAQLLLLAVLSLALIWGGAAYELNRSHDAALREAEVRTAVNAHVFAEYSQSTLRRINEFILDVRTRWSGDWAAFSKVVQQAQENIDDLTFQVSVVDRDGILAFSNLAKPSDRTDLGEREHFRVHKERPGVDRLFISRPLKGKVSGKWSIQVTRPMFKGGEFNGVIVVSLSPDKFAGFAEKLHIGDNSAMTVVRNTGEIMARYPALESSLGQVLKDRPYLQDDAPVSGNLRQVAATDGRERIYGYYRLPAYGMIFVLGEAVDEVLAPHVAYGRAILGLATLGSLALVALFFTLFRSLASREELRHQLMAIFALSPDGFVAFGARRRVRYASPGFLRMTGFDEAEVVGMDEDAFGERLARVCAEHSRFPGVAALRAAAPDGGRGERRQLIELTMPGKPVIEVGIRLSQGGAVSQVLYFRDVTRENEVDRMKTEFLSTAAHELRTPMASIFGYSEVMLAQEFPPEQVRELLGIIYRQSQLMVSILNELLDLVRIEERQGKDFEYARVDAAALLGEAAANFKPPEGREAPRLLPCQRGVYWMRADLKKLMQALGNVLSNAYKYSPAGGEVVADLLGSAEGGAARCIGLRIRDRGIGMTAQQLARVGERFYRADTSGRIPGTGLGMSIVREIVGLHGGRVEIQSREGEGTAVTLWIPAA